MSVELSAEKECRVRYQGIVYAVCRWIDSRLRSGITGAYQNEVMARLNAVWGRFHEANTLAASLQAELAAARKDSARLREALEAEAACGTCQGEKRISMECAYCLGGAPPPCKCDKEEKFECPECAGTGISLKTDKARAAVAAMRAEAQKEPK